MLSFKNRRIDRKKVVQVYRNLNDHSGKRKWLIKQGGLVVAHTNALCLRNVKFIASQAGMEHARRLGHRTVCAYARGYVVSSVMGTDATHKNHKMHAKIGFSYDHGFTANVSGLFVTGIKGADGVIFNTDGCYAACLT